RVPSRVARVPERTLHFGSPNPRRRRRNDRQEGDIWQMVGGAGQNNQRDVKKLWSRRCRQDVGSSTMVGLVGRAARMYIGPPTDRPSVGTSCFARVTIQKNGQAGWSAQPAVQPTLSHDSPSCLLRSTIHSFAI